jgi:hypothetical protein
MHARCYMLLLRPHVKTPRLPNSLTHLLCRSPARSFVSPASSPSSSLTPRLPDSLAHLHRVDFVTGPPNPSDLRSSLIHDLELSYSQTPQLSHTATPPLSARLRLPLPNSPTLSLSQAYSFHRTKIQNEASPRPNHTPSPHSPPKFKTCPSQQSNPSIHQPNTMSSIPLNFVPISFIMALIMIIMNAIQLYWARPQRAGFQPGVPPGP